jgi:DNA replication protein DnaC
MNTDNIKGYCDRLRLSYIPNNINEIVVDAQKRKPTYFDFLENVLEEETNTREYKAYLVRLKSAKLPPKHNLNDYDFSVSTGISEQQLKELRQLAWLEQAYNLVLMGPSGTGKTYIAAGLIYDTIKAGKKAYMISMEDILTCLRTKDISTSALVTYNKWQKADLIAIDDIMLFPVKKEESASFFNMINSLHEKTSVIITTNKAPTEWVQTLNDEVLATAILDRLLYRCEVIKLAGTSYRLENRKTIFREKA